MKIAFVDKPTIDFSLKLIGGDINTIPFVANSLRHLITNSLVDLMVWPQKIWVPWEKRRERTRTLAFIENWNPKCRGVGEWHKRFGKRREPMTSFKSFVAVELNQKNARRKYTEAKGGRSPCTRKH